MIVVDGAVYRGSLRNLNPADIESIDVLKGASAAAIYGSNAASGVIQITTKKGREGKPVINVTTKIGGTESTNANYGVRGPQEYIDFRQAYLRSTKSQPDYYWNSPDNLPEGVSLEEWRALNSNPLSDDKREFLSRLNFFSSEIEAYLSGHTINWYDKVMQTGLRQSHNVSIRGGTQKTNYYLSGEYVNNEGIIRGDKFTAYRTRANLSYKMVDWFEVGTNTQFSVRTADEVSACLGCAQTVSPYAYMRNEDGSLKWYPHDYQGAGNPLIDTFGQTRNSKVNDLFSSLYAEAALPFGITYKLSFEPRFREDRNYNFWSEQTFVGGLSNNNGFASRSDNSSYRWMVENLLKWKKAFGVHEFDVTLMQNAEKSTAWSSYLENSDFQPYPALGYSGLQYGTEPALNTNDTEYTSTALMARLNYILLDKYLLTASIRRDGYSAFGQRHPKATFPAVAFAWQIAKEDFFNVNWINRLKLRLSWGVNGNRNIGRYSALATLNSTPYYDGDLQIGLYTSSLANPDLRWEETESINFGLDIGILEDRVDLSVNYYDMTTHNLLVNRTLPSLTGFGSVTTNIGELGNKGFEMTLNTENISSSNFNWSSHLVFSFNRNKLLKLFGKTGEYTLLGKTHNGEIPDFQNEWFIGRSIGAVWNYDMTGIWQVDEAEEAAKYGLEPGDIKARDVNNDGAYTELQDKRFIGHTEPRYRIGFRNEINFLQNFTASVFIRAELGHIRPFYNAIHYHSGYDRINTPPTPYWTKENKSNEWPRLGENVTPYGGGVMVYKSASYVRIQNFSLSYNMPSNIVHRFQLQNARIFCSAQNLATFTNWPGWDPESGFNAPMPRTYTIGINLSL